VVRDIFPGWLSTFKEKLSSRAVPTGGQRVNCYELEHSQQVSLNLKPSLHDGFDLVRVAIHQESNPISNAIGYGGTEFGKEVLGAHFDDNVSLAL
jgi:hypothetical protein